MKDWDSPTCHESEVQLTELLRLALCNILMWRTGEWSSVSKTLPGQQKFTREQWENMQIRYPKVRPPSAG